MRLFLFVMPGAGRRTGEEQPSYMGSWRMRMRSRSTAGGSRFDSCAALHFIPERVKTTDIRYKDPRTRCTKCGKLLPAGRKRLCYECRPNKRYKTAVVSPPAPPKPRYTFEEQDARAEARGLTYGQLVNLENNGLPLPPLRRSVQWPWDSPHRGEEQI